jgi:hypothetical protein
MVKGQWPSRENPALNKWSAILRWSLGLERWTKKSESAPQPAKA